MITADTITTENCWECEEFCTFWDRVEELRDNRYSFLPIMDDGFELSILVDAWANGQEPEPTIESIADGWDPTPETAYDFYH